MSLIILILLSFFLLIGLFGSIIVTYLYIKHKKNSKAIGMSFINNLQCPETTICPRKISDLEIPIQKDNNYDNKVARYLVDLVARLENSVNSKLIPPKNLKKELDLYNTKENPLFGIVWSNNDTVYIIFRGTMSTKEFIQDLNYSQKVFPKHKKISQNKALFLSDNNAPNIHSGFLEVYNNLRQALLNKLKELKPKQILVSGHSLGAATSTICGLDLKILGYNVLVYNFASPRVGDYNFCNMVEKIYKLPLFRLVNTCDIVPTYPPPVCPNFEDKDNPYLYLHCGKVIYFTNNWKSVINNHLLGVYINSFKNIN